MAGEEHYIYLSSLGNRDIYPENTPNQFENRLEPPIQLDPNKDYEVGMLNCLYPKVFYALPKHDFASRIEMWVKIHSNPSQPYLLYTYVPRSNIQVGDTKYMLNILNKEMSIALRNAMRKESVRNAMKMEFSHYFKSNEFFTYDDALQRTNLVVRKGLCNTNNHFCKVSLRFGSRIASVLGFAYPAEYVIYAPTVPFPDNITNVPAPFPPRVDGDIDFALFFADCVSPTRYGGQSVNLLEAITMERAGGGDFHQIAYKTLSKTLLDSISIKVTDQSGRPIRFGEGKSMTVLLHVRPK